MVCSTCSIIQMRSHIPAPPAAEHSREKNSMGHIYIPVFITRLKSHPHELVCYLCVFSRILPPLLKGIVSRDGVSTEAFGV
jgi:hypothetical protein